MSAVARDVAALEVEKWMDYKKVNPRKREQYKENIETLIDAVSDGVIVLDDEYQLVHELNFPLKGDMVTSKLEYKPRLTVHAIHQALQGIKAADADGRICAYIAALTGKPKGVVAQLDTEDYSIAQSIAIFFL